MMMLYVSPLRGNPRRHVICLCEYVSMTTVNECGVLDFGVSDSRHHSCMNLHCNGNRYHPLPTSAGTWDVYLKMVTRTHYGIWSSHFSTCLCICSHVYIYVYPATSVSPSGDGISWSTLSVLKHYHVVQGNFPNISYSIRRSTQI